MTEKARGPRCRWCRAPLARRPGPGRPREFCRASCRQAAYRARQLAAGHGLGADEVVVAVADLEALADAVYTLQAALEDVAVDLEDAQDADDLRAVLEHLREAATPVAGLTLLPVSDRGPG